MCVHWPPQGKRVYTYVKEDQKMIELAAKLLSKPERHVLFISSDQHLHATQRPSSPLSKQIFGPLFRNHFTLRTVDKTSHDDDSMIETAKRTKAQVDGLEDTVVAGLVNRANHSAEYIEMMSGKGIYHLQVCEAENLLWTPEVLRLVCVSVGLVTASESALALSSPPAITGLEGMEAVREFFAELFASLQEEKDGKGNSTAGSIYDDMIDALIERWTTYLQRQTESESKHDDKTLKDAKWKAKQQKAKVPVTTASNDDDAQPATAAAAGVSTSKPAEPPVLRYFRQALPTGSHLHAATPTRETVATIIRRYITELRGKMALKDYKTDEWDDLAKKQQIEVGETLKKITELNVDEPDEPDSFYGSLRLWAKELVDDIVERGDVERALEHLSHHGVVDKLNEFVRKKKGGASSTFDIRKTVERLLQTNEDMRQAMLLRVPPQLLAIMHDHAADELRGTNPHKRMLELSPLSTLNAPPRLQERLRCRAREGWVPCISPASSLAKVPRNGTGVTSTNSPIRWWSQTDGGPPSTEAVTQC